MPPMSPTKDGRMLEDKYWIIKKLVPGFDHPYTPHCEVFTVTTAEVNFRVWQQAPEMAELIAKTTFEDRHVGRRINDEVELFEIEGRDPDDYESLRKCLEEEGFTVRRYTPLQSAAAKNRVLKRLGPAEKKTVMGSIMENMGAYVMEGEYAHAAKVEYGFIADVPGAKKCLCVARVDEGMFERWKGEDMSIPARIQYTLPDEETQWWKVVGEVRDGQVSFRCDEETTKSYFDGMGELKRPLTWLDLIAEKEQKEKAVRMAEKKAAKKHRRKMTESTTSASTLTEFSFGPPVDGDEDAIKARQRAKNNEKRKQQKHRKRTQAEQESRDPTDGISINLTTSDNAEAAKSGDEDPTGLEVRYRDGGKIAPVNGNGDPQLGIHRGVEQKSEEEESKPKVKLPKMDAKHNGNDNVRAAASGDEQANQTMVVHTVDQVRPLLEAGRPFVVVTQEQLFVHRTSTLNFVGRGL